MLVGEYLRERGLQLNPQKSCVVKFRKGGRLAKHDKLSWEGKPIQFVSNSKYLGLNLTATGTSFTLHVESAAAKATSAMAASIERPKDLPLDIANRIFFMKAVPILAYGLKRIWKYLSVANFDVLERTYTLFMKRVLCLSPRAKSRYVYVLCQRPPMVEEIRRQLKAENTEAFTTFVNQWEEKTETAGMEVQHLQIFTDKKLWEGGACKRRHIYTRLIAHGYHHKLCKDQSFHDPDVQCICIYCEMFCDKYHSVYCTTAPPLAELAQN